MTQTALDTNAVYPLSHQQWNTIQALKADLRPDQLHWLSGYFAGAAATIAAVPAHSPQSVGHLTILYGSQTGNCQKIAERAAKAAAALGMSVELHSMADYRASKLKQETWVLFVVSTHGEGEPPDAALQFYKDLHSKRVAQLSKLQYSVLALGDSSYKEFCKTGRDIDERLAQLGASSVLARVDCDVAFDIPAEAWVESALDIAAKSLRQETPNALLSVPGAGFVTQAEVEIYHDSPTRPYSAPVLEKFKLSGRTSDKEVWHLELSLEDSGIAYQAGDALGVIAPNDPQLVESVLQQLPVNSEDEITLPALGEGTSIPLRQALTEKLEITRLTRPVIQAYADLSGHESLLELVSVADDDRLAQYLDGRDWLDLLTEYPLQDIQPQQLVTLMRPLAPRLYSIASSPSAYPDEVHLTIAAARWQSLQRQRGGVASTYVADHMAVDSTLPVYLHRNENFRLPQDGDAPIIMIGPGTGVAPFRAFVEERQLLGHQGKNWLFFGDRHFRSDFLYQTDWLRWRKDGLLQHIDVAFSRDQTEKVYVQHRILQRGGDFYRWMQSGAYIYICGDALCMAKDVESAILQVIQTHGGLSADAAVDYLSDLQQQRRYQRDVY